MAINSERELIHPLSDVVLSPGRVSLASHSGEFVKFPTTQPCSRSHCVTGHEGNPKMDLTEDLMKLLQTVKKEQLDFI